MSFPSASAVHALKVAGETVKNLDEMKLIARAGISCCFLNGRGFKSVHEVGVSLIYVYILLVLKGIAQTRHIFIRVAVSFVFMVLLHLALQVRKTPLSHVLSCIFCIADFFSAIDLSGSASIPYLFGVSVFSLGILFVLYVDGRSRPGLRPCMLKDCSLAVYFLMKNSGVSGCAVLTGAVILGIVSLTGLDIFWECSKSGTKGRKTGAKGKKTATKKPSTGAKKEKKASPKRGKDSGDLKSEKEQSDKEASSSPSGSSSSSSGSSSGSSSSSSGSSSSSAGSSSGSSKEASSDGSGRTRPVRAAAKEARMKSAKK
ncbi:uncharacterized protein NEMAJ01_1856 [Nematocida major]|uniref:uncharacterized protein n=1 Tax=Nematocida major TaxID=1912982 RepID=UPI0020080110|nr:uncharacterized protein NEMAJ01_1856 [Nematocida major]KAH9386960.1 hypothetical protein NEMAJ01_1856 [Nematocida major]